MSSSGSITALVDRLKGGDQEAARHLWERYYPRMVALARKKLQGASRRVADEEDAALSAFDSFCRRAQRGQFPDIKDRESLWPMLVIITARKVADHIKHDRRAKRGGGLVGESALPATQGPAGLDGLAGDDPTPEEAALLAEEVETLLGRLVDPAVRQVAVSKLEGYSNAEIAERQGCSVPTVERRLAIVRRMLQEP